jgi:hypothetical protein
MQTTLSELGQGRLWPCSESATPKQTHTSFTPAGRSNQAHRLFVVPGPGRDAGSRPGPWARARCRSRGLGQAGRGLGRGGGDKKSRIQLGGGHQGQENEVPGPGCTASRSHVKGRPNRFVWNIRDRDAMQAWRCVCAGMDGRRRQSCILL